MDSNFWINRWTAGEIGFHQPTYLDKLLEYFPLLNPEKGQRVLVPLCGKSKDLAWLSQLELNVHGVELYEKAAESFFVENTFPEPQKNQTEHFTDYSSHNVTISCGDFFKLNRDERYDLVYDRAALVALPLPIRKNYAEMIRHVLKEGGKYLLITYEYDQTLLAGPPFSVGEKEIHELYGKAFLIRRMESQKPTREGPRMAALENVMQTVYLLEKNR